MKQVITCLVAFFTFFSLSAQMAPDFTITDPSGSSHTLYSDYLDQGKVVAIKVFFVDCPPCNSSAPAFQTEYNMWGSGSGDVEFMALSNKSWDSNTDVQGFKNLHSLSMPGAGNDGGGLAAITALKSVFNGINGTPYYMVIAPDGTAQLNVSLGGLGTAIQNALNIMPPPVFANFDVSVASLNANDMQGVDLKFEIPQDNDPLFAGQTGAAGNYTSPEFELPIDPAHVFKLSKGEMDQKNGISTYDLVLIQKHLLELDIFDDVALYVAADANGTNSVTALDIVELRKLLLGNILELPNVPAWRFIDANSVPADPLDPFSISGIDCIPPPTILEGVNVMEFQGIKVGDINLNAEVNGFTADEVEDRALFEIEIKNDAFEKDDRVHFVLEINETNLAALQIGLACNQEIAGDLVIQNLRNANLSNTDGHQSRTILYPTSTDMLLAEGPFLSIEFTALKAASLKDVISLRSDLLASEVYDNDGIKRVISLRFSDSDSGISIGPNPTTGLVQFGGTIAEVLVFNGAGKRVFSRTPVDGIDLSGYEAGLYLLRLRESNGKSTTMRIIKL